ncbi:polymorphic toxin type 44 domain-containing protein [Achromobacter kerstersii]|uniref:polymorphic toxin type 44 domain-containing protein n=1 Tax=Achromobacter kerstersii TaxID=1353890 RepID=UPI00320AFC7C
MVARPIIRIGDRTSHDGTVLQGVDYYTIDGRVASGLGHMVSCPKCEGTFPITQGVASFTVDGIPLAVEGMQTSCGATLISSQSIAVLVPANSDWAATWRDGQLLLDTHSIRCHHPDTAVELAEYMVREMKTNPFSIEGRKIAAANSADPDARAAEWRKLPWYAKLEGKSDYQNAALGQKAAAYAMWTERVGPGRPWDHKPVLRQRLGKKNLNRGWQKYGDFDYYYDIWSNIHYGYVGVAIGFSAAELLNGAGLAQALFDSYQSVKEGRFPEMQNHPENGPWPASADDVPDHISILLGCELYAAAKPHELNAITLLQRIAAVPLPWGVGNHWAKERHNCDR